MDTATDPQEASDALFATDNFQAGVLIGEWAKAAMGDKTPVIATLDLAPGITVGAQRHNGFMKGFGLAPEAEASSTDNINTPEVVCSQDTAGDQTKGQTAMENCLSANPDINLVYTINEPAAFGAFTAIKNAGKENDILIVSVDGGCAGVRGVVDGQIDATSQQYPLKMASLGVETVVNFAKTYFTGALPEAWLFVAGSFALLLLAAWMLNPLCLKLAPVPLFFFCLYSSC